jgi:hypothetical protein
MTIPAKPKYCDRSPGARRVAFHHVRASRHKTLTLSREAFPKTFHKGLRAESLFQRALR